jgi:glycosyltransferase involved in cell wall biosynthesis
MPAILIFCKTLLKGGAEKQALTLSKLLAEKNVSVVLVCWCGNKIDSTNMEFIKANSLRYIGLDGNPISKFRKFLNIIDEGKIEIVLSYLTKVNILVGATKLFKHNLITIGGIRTEKLPYYKFVIEKIVHNHFNNKTVFNNYSGRDKFDRKGFNSRKTHVIHNTIQVAELNTEAKTDNETRIISVCRFVKSKDFRTALYSFKQLVERNKDRKFKYLIVGYGPLEEYIRVLVTDLEIVNEVEILINPPNIPGILSTCDIYLSTSLYEGLSNSIMEAMAAGLPVVATNVGDNSYLIKDGYNGFIVNCGDIDHFVEKLEYLAKNENLSRQFGVNSHSIVRSEFSSDKFLNNYFQLFEEVRTS